MSILLAVIMKNICYLLPVITVPLVFQLYNSVKDFYRDSSNVPILRWWNFPMGNVQKMRDNGTASFYFRLYFARNIMIWFSIFMIVAILYAK